MLISLAKTTRPDLPGIVPRERLFQSLDRSSKRPIVWISAPAGAGKTTLVASWLEARNLPCLWYRLDGKDGDAATFFFYLSEAGRKATPRHPKALPHFTYEYLLDLPTFIRNFFENLFVRLNKPSFVVFDDYHEVPADSHLQKILQHGLDLISEGMSVIFISRSAPPPFMTRFVADGQLALIGQQELLLTMDETAEIVRRHTGAEFQDSSLQELYERAQGWVAGVILTMEESLENGRQRQSGFNGNPREFFSYFAGEVFAKADEREREFLLKTSFPPEVTSRIAEELTGFAGTDRILESLHRRCFFTEKKLLHPDHAYRYHPLFREFLQEEARRTFSPVKISDIERQAAILLEEAGEFEDAALLYRDAEEWEGLTRLILSRAQTLISQGRSATLEEWIGGMPREMGDRYPWLLFWQGVCRQNFAPAEGRKFYERAFQLFEADSDPVGLFLSWAGAADTYFLEWDDFTPLDPWIDWLDGYVRRNPVFPSPEIEASVASSMTSALANRHPCHPDIDKWAERALAKARKVSNLQLRLKVCVQTFLYHLWTGHITQTGIIVEEMRKITQSAEAVPLMHVYSKSSQAHHLNLAEASFDEALEVLNEAARIAHENGIRIADQIMLPTGFFIAMNKGDTALAREFLTRFESTLTPSRRHGFSQYNCCAAWLALSLGDTSRALVHAEAALDYAVATGSPLPELICRTALADLLAEIGDRARAAAEFEKAAKLAERCGSLILRFQYLIVVTGFFFSRGDEKRGMEHLRNALQLGREQHYLDTFGWWRPAVVSKLCMKALEHGIEVPYVQELVRKRSLKPDSPHSFIEQWPWPLKIYTFGRFGLIRNGAPVTFAGKVQQKPLEMLKALIALGGRNVAEKQLSDHLWPNADWEEAHRAFTVTLHRLRRLLGSEKFIELNEGRLSLNSRSCWVDTWAFERLAGEAEELLKKRSGEVATALGKAQKAIALYRGDFFAGDMDRSWSLSRRERLRSRMLRLIGMVGREHEEQVAWDRAIDCYLRGLDANELAEELYQRLMHCYRQMGLHGEIASIYQRCRMALAMHGIKPSPRTKEIYEETLSN